MFVLNPGGSSGEGGASSPLRQNLWFFGKLGLYFGAIRLAFVFFSGREQGAIDKDSSSSK
jgi:hypothetical protein